jgi:hypothetical protein
MNERLKELAFQAAMQNTLGCFWQCSDDAIERFAELVREDERDKLQKHYLVIVDEVRLYEREACAMVVNGRWLEGLSYQGCADAIRARGEK